MGWLVVLVPVRNAAADLPGWLEAVERFADAVVALDDGSSDASADVLEAHPLTKVLLRNPTRDSYAGWDDAANRQRLVDACADLAADWLLQLDADERLPEGDAQALRLAVDRGALDPAAGYLLQVLRMVEHDGCCDAEHFDEDRLEGGDPLREGGDSLREDGPHGFGEDGDLLREDGPHGFGEELRAVMGGDDHREHRRQHARHAGVGGRPGAVDTAVVDQRPAERLGEDLDVARVVGERRVGRRRHEAGFEHGRDARGRIEVLAGAGARPVADAPVGERRIEAAESVEHFDEDHLWVGRLFAWRPGLRLPSDRLHLVPLPVDIPAERRIRTTLRIRHYGSATTVRRKARRDKYLDADPDRAWQQDYDRLLEVPGKQRHLGQRPPYLPVVPNERWPAERDAAGRHPADEPLLTAIVISRDDAPIIERAVGSVVAQQVSAPVQTIVVTSGTDRTADIVAERFPEVELVTLDRPALPGEARNAGLARARGRYVTFPGSHIELPDGSLEARLQCHLDGWCMVTGTTHNGTRTPAGWASYFLDHSGSLPARPSYRMQVAPSYASYLTDALRRVGGFPEDMRTAEDTVVNTTLFGMGYGAWQDQDVTMIHHSPCRTVARLVRQHHTRGRGLGQMILRNHPPGRPLLTPSRVRSLGIRYVPGRFHRIHHYTWRYGEELRWRWLAVAPLCALAIVAAWAGAWREILRPGPGRMEVLFAGRLRPGRLARRAGRALRRRVPNRRGR